MSMAYEFTELARWSRQCGRIEEELPVRVKLQLIVQMIANETWMNAIACDGIHDYNFFSKILEF